MNLFARRKNNVKIFDRRDFKNRLKKIAGYSPKDLNLFEEAFIHRSATFVRSDGTKVNNERLEYLGDAVLDTVMSDFFFERYPNASEGFLTKIRSRVVSREELNQIAKSMGLNDFLVNKISAGNYVKNLYGDAFEAFIGAIFLDCGYKKTKKILLNKIFPKYIDFDKLINTDSDYKSLVYEWGQKHKKDLVFESDEGYDKDQKHLVFSSVLYLNQQEFGKGAGLSKKEAEQEASRQAWLKINDLVLTD